MCLCTYTTACKKSYVSQCAITNRRECMPAGKEKNNSKEHLQLPRVCHQLAISISLLNIRELTKVSSNDINHTYSHLLVCVYVFHSLHPFHFVWSMWVYRVRIKRNTLGFRVVLDYPLLRIEWWFHVSPIYLIVSFQ